MGRSLGGCSAQPRESADHRLGTDPGSGAYVSANQDGFDAARLLLGPAAIAADLRQTIRTPVAIAPDRSTLVIADADNHAAIEAGLDLALAIYLDEEAVIRKLSPTPLVAAGDGWKGVLPGGLSSRLAGYDRKIRVLEFHDWYRCIEEQREGHDSFALIDDLRIGFRGEISSAPWIEGRTYLCEAEEVRLYRRQSLPDGAAAFVPLTTVPWRDLIENLGADAIELEDIWPPVYRVNRFPSPAELSALQGGVSDRSRSGSSSP
jgi:hypothetical protein